MWLQAFGLVGAADLLCMVLITFQTKIIWSGKSYNSSHDQFLAASEITMDSWVWGPMCLPKLWFMFAMLKAWEVLLYQQGILLECQRIWSSHYCMFVIFRCHCVRTWAKVMNTSKSNFLLQLTDCRFTFSLSVILSQMRSLLNALRPLSSSSQIYMEIQWYPYYHWKVMLITKMKATIMSRWICDGDRVW